jgi:GntR family transcriptional repressor for pyruvate dehydrogenase complex
MRASSASQWEPNKQVSRGNAAEQILDDLKDQIVSGKLERGVRLPSEKQLAEGYGVSGATIREALRSLSSSHFIEVRHGSGAYVTAESNQIVESSLRSMIQLERIDIPQVFGVLRVLNGYAAELAASNATDEHLETMRQALDEIEEGESIEAIFSGLTTFVNTLGTASLNPLLSALSRFLSNVQIKLTRQLASGSLEECRAVTGQLSPERRKLLNALVARKPTRARDAAHLYHERAMEIISALPNPRKARFSDSLLPSFLASMIRQTRR